MVPELRWADAPPVLTTWARANLSLRSARERTGAADGYLARGAAAVVISAPGGEIPAVVGAARGACVLVASVSSPEENRHLGVLAASPECGLGRGGLRSPSTHRAHLATLYDVGTTFLDVLGAPRPAEMGGPVVRPASAVSTATLVDHDRRAATSDRLRTPLSWLFVALTAVGAAVALRWRRARPAVAWALLAVRALRRDGLVDDVVRKGERALAVAAVIGSAVNDSGLLVGAAVTTVGWPALLAVDSVDPASAGARAEAAAGAGAGPG